MWGVTWGSLRCSSLPPTELLSAECGAACSPRLSPDGQRLLYLEGTVGGPHRQCLRLRMVSGALRVLGTAVPRCTMVWYPAWDVTASHCARLGPGVGSIPKPPYPSFPGWGPFLTTGSLQLTWQTRQTVTVLEVVQEPMEGECGTVGRAWCCQGDGTPHARCPWPRLTIALPTPSLCWDLHRGASTAVLGSRQPASGAEHPTAEPYGEPWGQAGQGCGYHALQ